MASLELYPPVVDNTLKGYLIDSEDIDYIKVYYDSNFNDSNEYQTLQAVIYDQITGSNIVNTDGKIIYDLLKEKDSDGRKFVRILRDELKNNFWKDGKIFKIKLRFSSVEKGTDNSSLSNWLIANANNFSEWSSVCKIKLVESVGIELKDMVPKSTGDTLEEYHNNVLLVEGNYLSSLNNEYLKELIFYLKNNNDKIIEQKIYKPKDVTLNNFSFYLDTLLEEDHVYKYSYEIITSTYIKKEYTSPNYKFKAVKISNLNSNFEILNKENFYQKEEGYNQILISYKKTENSTDYSQTKLKLERSDSYSNFSRWESILFFTPSSGDNDNYSKEFNDITIENGILYRYRIFTDDEFHTLLYQSDSILGNFEYSYLLGEDSFGKTKQLKLCFNNTMDSFRYQVNETSMDTIGGTYPVVTRNASTYYRTFPINGLISYEMDSGNLFCSDKELFGNTFKDFLKTNKDNISKIDKNILKEKLFRKKVLDFLYDGKVKLFKSPTEGNILVRLTNVSLSPNQSLGRMIYSFSANAVEIAEATIENYRKYNLLNLDDSAYSFNENSHSHNLSSKTPEGI